ncbi:fimbrial protein [Paraherbaspirillum soli]|uniref:Fimbrial protein n=1 Tax=Paraherbaspirillum soli TaxID=631222 RepID=A0ABW0M343_9BURK
MPSNTAIDSVIATAYSGAWPTSIYAICRPGGSTTYNIVNMGPEIPVSRVYPTKLPGIGIRITSQQADGGSGFPAIDKVLNIFTSWPDPKSLAFTAGSNMKVELIKTGPFIRPGTAIEGVLAKQTLDSGEIASEVRSNRVEIKEASDCVVSAPSLTIDFGSFGPKTFIGDTGPAQPINFSVKCSGGSVASITATLSAFPDAGNANAIAINGTARGMAIQISDKESGKILQPNNLTSVLIKQAGTHGTPVDFQLNGTVVKNGRTLAAGPFGAIATINLMYN